jgi:hypothetical protein
MSIHDWRAGFLFVGNQLALDFVNTKPLRDGSPRELLPDNDALLRWLSAAGLIEKAEANGLRHSMENTREQFLANTSRFSRETARGCVAD